MRPRVFPAEDALRGMPGTRPPGNPQSNAPGRTATSVRSRGAGTPEPRASAPASVLSMRLDPLGQPAAPDHLDRAVAAFGNPRAIDPPPAAAVARRMAARHTNRQSQRPKHGPHPLPLPAPDSPPYRVQLAQPKAPRISRSRHPTSTSSRSPSAEPTCRTAPNNRRRPPRSRTARGHDRARASDVQASFRAAIAVPARPQLPFGSAGTFPAGNAPNRDRESLIHIFPVNDAADQMLQPARQRRHIERIVQRVDGELRLTAQALPRHRLPTLRTPPPRSRPSHRSGGRRGPSNGRWRVTGSTSPAATTSPPQSGHITGDGSRTSTAKRVRQPEHRPGLVSRRSGCIAGR